jgi:hypothetical protein
MKLTAREIWLRQHREAKLKTADDKTVTKPFTPVGNELFFGRPISASRPRLG